MRHLAWAALLMVPVLTCGCTSLETRRAAWVADHGGLGQRSDVRRAQAALSRLLARVAATSPDLRIGVLNCAAPCAFSWADGRLFISHGLLTLATDDELSAAIAHELGHLVADRRLVGSAMALEGRDRAQDAEQRADAIARRLMAQAGVADDALARVLRKVASDRHTDALCRAQIAKRLVKLAATGR